MSRSALMARAYSSGESSRMQSHPPPRRDRAEGETEIMPFSRIFTLEADGHAILSFEASNVSEAKQLSKGSWLLDDLKVFTSNGVPLRTNQSQLSVRPATAEEAIVFGHAAEVAKPSDDFLLAYLVELDGCG
jgi:hypothetical protein